MTPRPRSPFAGRGRVLAALSCALVLIASLFVLAAPARAVKASYTSDGFTYRILEDADGSEVHVFATSLEGHVTIPATLGGSPVTTVGPQGVVGFGAENDVDSFTFSEGIKTVEEHAFDSWRDFDGAYIPRSLEYAGSRSFWIDAPSWVVYYGGTRAEWDALLARSADDCGLGRDNVIVYFQCSEYGDVTGEEPEDPTPPEEPGYEPEEEPGEPAVCGRYLEDGEYSIRFRSSVKGEDLAYEFSYSESYFLSSATEYDHDLAVMSLGLVMSGFSTAASEEFYTMDGSVGREDNIRDAYDTLGFAEAEFHNYDMSLNDASDKVAFSFARKTYEKDGETVTVIPVILRGGGYGAEWASNFHVEDDSAHNGFRRAAQEVYGALEAYLQSASARDELGDVNLWIGGYSRGAAVANLLAAQVCNRLDAVAPEDVFAYTFATPNCVTGMQEGGVSWDYRNNWNAAFPGVRLENFEDSCIHNIIYSGDAVPRIPLDDWGYYRNGNDMFLPVALMDLEISRLESLYLSIADASADFSSLPGKSDVQANENALGDMCGSIEWYVEHYQDAFRDIFQYMNTRPAVTWTGDNLAEVAEAIGSLEVINASETAVRAAIYASEPIMEVLGDKFGLGESEKDEYLPLVAIALLHGAGDDAIGVLVQYFLGFFDDVSIDGVPLAHQPEVYLAHMLFYDGSYFDLEPSNRDYASFDSAQKFSDVPVDAFFRSAVSWAVDNEVTTGTTPTTFSPNSSCTRADALTFLWRAQGCPEPLPGECPFTDVSREDFYYKPVMWAYQNHVTTGSTPTTFSPTAICTRADALTLQWRVRELGEPSGSTTSPFEDVSTSDFFFDAVVWADRRNVTTGMTPTTFAPTQTCTRAQVVTFLYRDYSRG